jgi:hypothetical protein
MMDWNNEQQKRFDDLRRRELVGMLTADEQAKLAEMTTLLEEEEAQYLGPAVARMELEQAVMQQNLQKLQADNEELAKLLHQQEQLEAALQSLHVGISPTLDHVPERFHADLQSLDQMSDNILWQIARTDLPDDKARLYESLLEKNQNEPLRQAEQEALDTLREEADVLMMRRAYAHILLKWHQIPAPAELIAL